MTVETLAFENALKKFNSTKTREQGAKEKSRRTYNELGQARRQLLQEKLDRRGLGFCSKPGFDHRQGLNDVEKLGLYPKDQIKTLYFSSHYNRNFATVENRCPVHVPEHLNQANVAKTDWDAPFLVFNSELFERDGRFFTVINEIETTNKGSEPVHMEDIYKHFGIQPLPQNPHL